MPPLQDPGLPTAGSRPQILPGGPQILPEGSQVLPEGPHVLLSGTTGPLPGMVGTARGVGVVRGRCRSVLGLKGAESVHS